MIGQAMDRLYEEEALCPVCLAKERVSQKGAFQSYEYVLIFVCGHLSFGGWWMDGICGGITLSRVCWPRSG